MQLLLLLFTFSFATSVEAANAKPSVNHHWNLSLDADSLLTAQTTEADLIKIFGKQNVTPSKINVGEGETIDGTVIYKGSATRELEIVWNKARIERILVQGDKSEWKFPDGLTIGTTLKDIEKLNGKAIYLAGFGWDYSGTVTSWQNGKFAEIYEKKTGRIIVRLAPDAKFHGEKDYYKVLGDKDFKSDRPEMQKLNPSIYQMVIEF